MLPGLGGQLSSFEKSGLRSGFCEFGKVVSRCQSMVIEGSLKGAGLGTSRRCRPLLTYLRRGHEHGEGRLGTG